MYRPEAEPNWEEANTAEATNALATYATQVAIELIQTNGADGNILIFMPGESSITMCMESMFHNATQRAHKAINNYIFGDSSDLTIEVAIQGKGRDLGKTIRVGIYAFHSRITELDRQKMLRHADQDCIIIFSTNVAETGLTLPNIRYVVDTGLERRVMWNMHTNTQELRTGQITQSSMKVRAGRVASGICFRLYSKETAKSFKPAPDPQVESGMIFKTVLTMLSISSEASAGAGPNSSLPLLTNVPKDILDNANSVLQLLGAVEYKNDRYEITSLGHNMIKIGLPLRQARFLLQCTELECLGSGIIIASMMSHLAYMSVLPSKSNPTYSGAALLHPSGDHFLF